MELFSIWITLFTIAFNFLPLSMVLDWRKRASSDGFSSVNLVLPMLIQSLWLRHGLMSNDATTIVINTVNMFTYGFYIIAFAYYQSKRKVVICQCIGVALTVQLAYFYADSHEPHQVTDVIGSLAASASIFSLAGGVYEIKRVISMGTTEYVSAWIQYAMFLLSSQWMIFALIHGNRFMAMATTAGILVNLATISLYFFYPPLTWTVPIFNIRPKIMEEEKKSE